MRIKELNQQNVKSDFQGITIKNVKNLVIVQYDKALKILIKICCKLYK